MTMPDAETARGGATVGVLTKLEPWEADLILNIRLWCAGSDGQTQVWSSYIDAFGSEAATEKLNVFETLLSMVCRYGHRPMVHHSVTCSCVGADESILAHLAGTASLGHLQEASLIATLLVGAGYAEQVALVAARTGQDARCMARNFTPTTQSAASNVVQLH